MTRDDLIARDRGSWEQRLRAEGGGLYHPSDLEGVVRNVSYAQNAGKDPIEFINNQIDIYGKRAAATSHRAFDSQSGLYPDEGGDPRQEPGYGVQKGRYRGPDPRAASIYEQRYAMATPGSGARIIGWSPTGDPIYGYVAGPVGSPYQQRYQQYGGIA